MNRERLAEWLHRIYSTGEAEIDCDRLHEILPAYVDDDIAGHDLAALFPQAQIHLQQCPDCAEEYRSLREVARLEAQGRLPQAEETLAQFRTESSGEVESVGIRPIPAP